MVAKVRTIMDVDGELPFEEQKYRLRRSVDTWKLLCTVLVIGIAIETVVCGLWIFSLNIDVTVYRRFYAQTYAHYEDDDARVWNRLSYHEFTHEEITQAIKARPKRETDG